MDGEKNLKKRIVPNGLGKCIPNGGEDGPPVDQLFFTGQCETENPKANLHSFDGNLFMNEKRFKLSIEQLLFNGTTLKNTAWVLGCTVYTGVDTKMMLNMNKGSMKKSNMDKVLNHFLITIFVI